MTMTTDNTASAHNLLLCLDCATVTTGPATRCPHCHGHLHRRKPASYSRTWAYLTTAIIALNLFCGIACLAGSPESWAGWIAWQKNPIMFVLNLAGIVGALLNSKTWFEAMPKAIRIQRGEKFLPDQVLIRAGWGAFGGVLVILLIIVAWLA